MIHLEHALKTRLNSSIVKQTTVLFVDALLFCHTEVWLHFVTKSLQSDEPVLPTVRCEIVRTLVQRMSDRQMLEDSDFVDVADEALRRMPHL